MAKLFSVGRVQIEIKNGRVSLQQGEGPVVSYDLEVFEEVARLMWCSKCPHASKPTEPAVFPS